MNLKILLLFVVIMVLFLSPNPLFAAKLEPALTEHSSGSINGRVVDERGKPVAGLVVIATRHNSWHISNSKAETSSDGSYIINGLAAGKYSVKLDENPTFVGRSLKNIWVYENKTTQAKDLIAIKGGVLSGRVVDKDTNKPVKYAIVEICGYGAWIKRVKVDDNGAYKAIVVPGQLDVHYAGGNKYYFTDPSTDVRVSVSQTGLKNVDVKIKKAGIARGIVVDEKGIPVAKADVGFRGNTIDRGQTITDENGAFEMPIIADDKLLFGHAKKQSLLEVRSESSAIIKQIDRGELLKGHTITALPYQMLKVVVKDPDGNRIGDAKVRKAIIYSCCGENSPTAFTDKNGEIVFNDLIVGGTYQLSAECIGYYQPSRLELPEVGSEGWKDTVELIMKKAERTQTGKVIDKDGNPVKGIKVITDFGPEVVTDADGNFTITNMPNTIVTLHANDGKMHGSASVDKYTGPIIIKLNRKFLPGTLIL